MLIYNHQKEFLGISESDLSSLGFSDLSELKRVSSDFADLFIKTPGYIHNFKHVHWIDFVNCAEESEESKVIINAKGKNFKAILDIKVAYLVDDSSQKAFFVNLKNLRSLTQNENDQISNDVLEQELQKKFQREAHTIKTPTFVQEKKEKEFSQETIQEVVDDPYEPDTPETEDIYNDNPINLDDDLSEKITFNNTAGELPKKETSSKDTASLNIDDAYELETEHTYNDNSINLGDNLSGIYEEKIISNDTVKELPKEETSSSVDDPYGLDTLEAEHIYKDTVKELPKEETSSSVDDPYGLDTLDTEHIYNDKPIDLDDDLSEIYEEKITSNDAARELPKKKTSSKGIAPSGVDKDYLYDPHLASTELGLPLDLIEEFIQDFIEQSMDFKENLYSSLQDSNIENIKALSHKLKGVAANLRIEDAFEVLSIINTSQDVDEIRINLNKFYYIISKLSSNSTDTDLLDSEQNADIKDSNEDTQNDDLNLSFKDDIDDTEIAPTSDDESTSEENLTRDESKKINIDDKSTQNSDLLNTQRTKKEPIYNKSLAANEIGISQENFNILFEDYILESKKICKQINESILNNNPQEWVLNAIKLKGMSDNMRVNCFIEELEEIINTKEAQVVKEKLKFINAKLQDISSTEG